MTQFADRFRNHRVHAELDALENGIQTASIELDDGPVRQGFDRFQRSVAYVRRCVSQSDPELTTVAALDALSTQLSSLNDRFEQVKITPDSDNLNA